MKKTLLLIMALSTTNVFAGNSACYDHFYTNVTDRTNSNEKVAACRRMRITCDSMEDIEKGKETCMEYMGEMSKLGVSSQAILAALEQIWQDRDESFIRQQAEDEIKRLAGLKVRDELLGK
ncbi:MAG: hypothetical protein HOE90_01430 [Bacteriovoracaceae bacterium]|jgi:hypothetical protein|nr:hypothetical protein [Bacteriovoracaceae bacterium]